MPKKKEEEQQLAIEDFRKVAEPYLQRLKLTYPESNPIIISDVILKQPGGKELQFVNLVQEGGGVLGVALVGYTYILEKMGIRFLRFAGTSAGAINTMIMACVGNKEEEKSEKILDILSKKNLFDFVDGTPLAKRLIKVFITNKKFYSVLKRIILILFILLFSILLLNVFMLGRTPRSHVTEIILVSSLIITTALAFFIVYIVYLVKRFDRNGYGINKGDDFENWIGSIITNEELVGKNEAIHNLNDFEKKINKFPAGLQLRAPRTESIEDLINPQHEKFKPVVTMITSDVTSQSKVEFPKMWNMYWKDKSAVNPAHFVRSSMSIPLFFEASKADNIDEAAVRPYWKLNLNYPDSAIIPKRALFVDGGVISNFPINIFYNGDVMEPRLPTLGILLDDDDAKPKEYFKSIGSYIMSIFNTVRFYYDKDFIIKHNDFEKTIGRIDVKKFNWLNFNIGRDDKLKLFEAGAKAAMEFLLGRERPKAVQPEKEKSIEQQMEKMQEAPKEGFSWSEYKQERRDLKGRYDLK